MIELVRLAQLGLGGVHAARDFLLVILAARTHSREQALVVDHDEHGDEGAAEGGIGIRGAPDAVHPCTSTLHDKVPAVLQGATTLDFRVP